MKTLTLALMTLIVLSSCNQDETAIKQVCPDCQIEEIEGTQILITTNSNGLANFYDTQNHSFMLSNWVEATYSKGIIYDDITINMNGQQFYLFKEDFSNISDNLFQQKLAEKDSEESNDSENSSSDSYNYCSKHSKMYLPENGCTECMYDGVEEELNKPGGFRDRAMRP